MKAPLAFPVNRLAACFRGRGGTTRWFLCSYKIPQMSYDEHVGRTEGALITFAPAVAQVVREEQLLQEGHL